MTLAGRTASRVLVVALSLFVLTSGVSDIVRLWHPIGWFGTLANSDFVVSHVAPGTPADRAGIRVGDRFDVPRLRPQERWHLFPANCLDTGIRLTVGIIRDDGEHFVTMTSVQEPMGAPERAALVVSVVTGLLFVLIGTFTILLRPSPVVWGFYLYCLGSAPFAYRYLDGTLKLPYSFIWLGAVLLVNAAALPGLLIFSLAILRDSVTGWRASLRRIALVSFVVLAGLLLTALTRNYLLGQPALALDNVYLDFRLAITITIAAVLFATYTRATGADRQRLRWMMVGIGIALFVPYIELFLGGLAASSPALFDAINVIRAAAPIGVAYAILKHRVINVSFFVSRTIVYAVITALLVSVFAFIDWLADKILAQSRLATILELLVAIGFGLWMNTLHQQVDGFVDNVLFRSRHLAERALKRLSAGLPHAASYRVVDEILAEETAKNLSLASTALFRRTSQKRFDRTSCVGWGKGTATALDDQDRLIIYLAGERESLRLSNIHWNQENFPTGPAEPTLAIPIFVRHELDAILILGAHITGEDLDAGEIRLLEECAVAASAAYDHLEADALRENIEELQHTLTSMRTTLQAHGLIGVSNVHLRNGPEPEAEFM